MRVNRWILILSLIILFSFPSKADEKNKPTNLSVEFLIHTGQVYLNGYPVNTTLYEAVGRNENFQFTEITKKKPCFGWVVNSCQNNTLQTAYRILVASM